MAQRLLTSSRVKKAKKSSAKRDRLPDRSSELLVNQRMLYAVRDELKADIRSHDKRFESIEAKLGSHDKRFESIEAKLASHDRRFDAIDRRFEAVDKRFDSLDAKLASMDAKSEARFRQLIGLMEEQNNRNLAVLDGYQSLYDRQDRVERELEEIKKGGR